MAEQLPPSKLRVFLCHSSGDKAQIRTLYRKLQAEPWLQPWLDEEDITAGLKWRNEIEKAVKESHVILVCLSPTSITKEGFVQHEIKVALDRADSMPENTIFIIPLKLEACEIPDRLSDLHWVNYFEERGHERLLKALRLRANELGIQLDSVGPPVVTAAKPAVEPKQSTPAPAPQPPPTEQSRLLRELTEPRTTHPRRLEIGELLNQLGDTRPGVGVQLDGTPDMVWLPVAPGGKLTIEKQTFVVPPFYIAKYQITNAQYQAFYQAHDGYNNPRWWRDMPAEYQPQELYNSRTATLNNPRDNVSWYQSVAFARWLHSRLKDQELLPIGGNSFRIGQTAQVRLPTEWEWQWAAQGGQEGREYPWGEWQANRANTVEAGLDQTSAVGMYPDGAASCGALDMAGNLLEWCLNKGEKPADSRVDASGDWRVLRGGAFYDNRSRAASAVRDYYGPRLANRGVGLRLVVAAPIAGTDG